MNTNHGTGTTTMMVAGGKKKYQTEFPDGTTLVEEYDLRTDDLLVRRWKTASVYGKESKWDYEIGEPNASAIEVESSTGGMMMAVSNSNPTFHARDLPECWEWRVRNIPYPEETYSVTVDEDKQELVLRTTNRKYFKRFKISCLSRMALPLDQAQISFEHSNNTLIIHYEKPGEVREMEGAARQERRAEMEKKIAAGGGGEGDVGCKQQ